MRPAINIVKSPGMRSVGNCELVVHLARKGGASGDGEGGGGGKLRMHIERGHSKQVMTWKAPPERAASQVSSRDQGCQVLVLKKCQCFKKGKIWDFTTYTSIDKKATT